MSWLGKFAYYVNMILRLNRNLKLAALPVVVLIILLWPAFSIVLIPILIVFFWKLSVTKPVNNNNNNNKENQECQLPKIKTCSEILEELKDVLNNDQYEDIKKTFLDSRLKRTEIQVQVEPNQDYWLGYNPQYPNRGYSQFILTADNTTKKDISNKHCIKYDFSSQSKCTILSIYTDHEEILSNDEPISGNASIAKSIYARYVSSIVKGYIANIQLVVVTSCHEEEAATKKLKLLVNLLINKKPIPRTGVFNFNGIVCTISGKLPSQYMIDNFKLTQGNIHRVEQMLDTKFFNNLGEQQQFALRVRTISVDAERYFAPLLVKLDELRAILPAIEMKWLVKVVIKEMLNKIALTTGKIVDGKDEYLYLNRFLNDIYTNFILDGEQVVLFEKALINSAQRDKWSPNVSKLFDTEQREFQYDYEITVEYRITLSIRKALINFQTKLIKLFNSNSSSLFDSDKLTEQFSHCIEQDLSVFAADIAGYESKRKIAEQRLRNNILTNVIFDESFIEPNTRVIVCLKRNGNVVGYSLSLLSAPENIQVVEVKENSITIKWDMDDQDEIQVMSYKVEYSLVSEDDTNTTWYSTITNDSEKVAQVKNIAGGSYIFRVRANFGTMFGLPSENSEVISTLPVEENENLNCSVCFENTVNIAFIPCGHTFCEVCAQNIHEKCPQCRTVVQNKMKIYHSL